MSKSTALTALALDEDPDTTHADTTHADTTHADTLCAPAVGRFSPALQSGSIRSGGDRIGSLEILGTHHPLLLPAHLDAVKLIGLPRGPVACGYGDRLARYVPVDGAPSVEGSLAEPASGAQTDLPVGAISVEAPIDGTLYYAASPEAPPFIVEGDVVESGQVIALIEVMKFFYEIHYEGATPARALRRASKDSSPIEAGQVLWHFDPTLTS